MATVKEDGGAAFPNPYIEADPLQHGMSLCDWFAGQIAVAIFSEGLKRGMTFPEMAEDAYSFAEAMLAERSRP